MTMTMTMTKKMTLTMTTKLDFIVFFPKLVSINLSRSKQIDNRRDYDNDDDNDDHDDGNDADDDIPGRRTTGRPELQVYRCYLAK